MTMQLSIRNTEDNAFVAIIAREGTVANTIMFPVPEDPQQAVAVADYFYKELLESFQRAGKANADRASASRAAAEMLRVPDKSSDVR